MKAIERTVGGIRCGEVLTHLSDYLDGELDAVVATAVEAHLMGCDQCARFGAAVSTVIAGLRAQVGNNGRSVEPGADT